MNLKAYCKQHVWQGVTFHLLGYRTVAIDAAVETLETFVPHWRWVHVKTGEVAAIEPDEQRKQRERAESMGAAFKPVWKAENLWSTRENTYAGVLPLLVAIDFPAFDASTPSEVRLFADFWNTSYDDEEQRWNDFKQFIGVGTVNALWTAYTATRDPVLTAPAGLQKEVEADEEDPKSSDAETET